MFVIVVKVVVVLKKKVIVLSVLFFLLVGVVFLQDTLAKYKKKVDVNTNLTLASWNIKVNNESILNKKELTAEIEPVFESNEYVKEGVIAPGSKGYFDIKIDATLADVSFKYTIVPTVDKDASVTDIITTGYEVNPGDTSNIIAYDENTGIEGEIVHNTSGDTIRIYIEWNDNEETQSMTNEDDTKAASQEDAKTTVNPIITFTQVKE